MRDEGVGSNDKYGTTGEPHTAFWRKYEIEGENETDNDLCRDAAYTGFMTMALYTLNGVHVLAHSHICCARRSRRRSEQALQKRGLRSISKRRSSSAMHCCHR